MSSREPAKRTSRPDSVGPGPDAAEAAESLDPESFNAAYEVLRRNAEQLRDQAELDIDSLVPLVEQSMQAYRICQARLDAVRRALESRLGDAEDGAADRTDDVDDA